MQKESFFKKNREVDQDKLCEKCGLYKDCLSPKMDYTGEGKSEILVLAESQGRQEDEQNIQLIGQSGQLLRKELRYIDIDLDRDCWKVNVVRCRPDKNRTPTTSEINNCRPNLLKTIEKLKPKKIITFGAVALQSLIGTKININAISRWIGKQIPDQDYKCWVFPLYHPSYILRDLENKALVNNFRKTLRQAFEHNKDFFTLKDNVNLLNEYSEIVDCLNSIRDGEVITFDYETSGLKPHKKGHYIKCISIGTENKTISFEYCDSLLHTIKKILENPTIKKIAHNLKFEHIWSKSILDINVKGWIWDTMLASHIIDSTANTTGLKFQTYINFGITGYDTNVNKYLGSKEKSDNAFNEIERCNIDDLLYYCGLDSFYTYKLYEKQDKEIKRSLRKGLELFLSGTIAFAEMQQNGIRFDREKFLDQDILLSKKLCNLHNEIVNNPDIGDPEKFNYNSTKQLRELFFNKLGLQSIKKTIKGADSVDKEVLESINHPIAENIIEHRYIKKIRDTYLAQFKREAVETKNGNYIYPNFNLNMVRSFRSSSSSPNLQNIPRRDEYTMNLTRGLLYPSVGNQLLEVDYGQIEVRIATCYNHDPEMIAYCCDPESDMHGDMAKRLFSLEKVPKELRNNIKGNFVFAQFYGDWWKNCAENIWENMTRQDKKLTGIKELGQLITNREGKIKDCTGFYKQVKDLEYWFWNNKFNGYKEWKENIWNRYLEEGFVRLKTGFICQGVMNRKDVSNYPIQGTAFHCLLKSLIDINNHIKENKLKSKIVGQIHDSIIFNVVPNELEELKKNIRYYMTEKIREDWKWIIVPLTIEAEITEIDQPWSTKKETDI